VLIKKVCRRKGLEGRAPKEKRGKAGKGTQLQRSRAGDRRGEGRGRGGIQSVEGRHFTGGAAKRPPKFALRKLQDSNI